MREPWARRLAWITCGLVLALSAVFAATRTLDTETTGDPVVPDTASRAPIDPAQVQRGRKVYLSLDCSGCHSVAGEGSPRSPLDGVGSRLDRAGIREWTLAGDSVADDLSPRARRTKQGYQALDEAKIESLLDYLSSLTD